MSKRYTVKRHIEGLVDIAEYNNWSGSCPAAEVSFEVKRFHSFNDNPKWCQKKEDGLSYKCKICRNFIKLNKSGKLCPCGELGKEEAIKRTLEELEKRGITVKGVKKK